MAYCLSLVSRVCSAQGHAWIALACIVCWGCGHGREPEPCKMRLDDKGNWQVAEGCPCAPGLTQRCFVGDPSRAGQGECNWGMQVCEGSGEFGHLGACVGSGTAMICKGVTPEACMEDSAL